MLALLCVPSAALRQGGEMALRRQPLLERGFLVGLVLGDIEGARHADVERIKNAAAFLDLGLEPGDALADGVERGELIEQKVVATLGHLADRIRAAGGHPHRRMRLLCGRRLDDDVGEVPVFAPMARSALSTSRI